MSFSASGSLSFHTPLNKQHIHFLFPALICTSHEMCCMKSEKLKFADGHNLKKNVVLLLPFSSTSLNAYNFPKRP